MIDFWEIAGRLMLMDAAKRKADIYEGILPISGQCLLPGHCQTATLPFPIQGFYDPLRKYLGDIYPPGKTLLSPVISMFALGEVGVMFFTPAFRTLFETLSKFLKTTSPVSSTTDTGASQQFYIVLALLVMDRSYRDAVTGGNFLGLTPAASEIAPLTTLANNQNFRTAADDMCLNGGWRPGSVSTLLDQAYAPPISAAGTGGQPTPFRHFRFVDGLP